jgi:hypothetical protein
MGHIAERIEKTRRVVDAGRLDRPGDDLLAVGIGGCEQQMLHRVGNVGLQGEPEFMANGNAHREPPL